MTRHLPSLAALAVAVLVAAVAYSVYDSSQSSGPDGASQTTRGGGLVAAPSTPDPAPVKPQAGRDSKGPRRAVHGGGRVAPSSDAAQVAPALLSGVAPTLLSGDAPGVGRPELRPVSSEPPARAPHGRPRPDGLSRLDRELQRLIDGPGNPKSRPAPRSPRPRSPKPVAPAPTPKPTAPGGGSTSPPPGQPAGPGAAPADPEAGLDDLPVGGLDETDLGQPVDETNPGATPTPPATAPADPGTTPTDPGAAPTDPDAGLDDTPAGGLDQADPAQAVDTTAAPPAGG
jgi:hypothetical protein